jgi:hypothetical protein
VTQYRNSLIRLTVPVLVGAATGLCSTVAKHLNPQLLAVISPVAAYLYYALAAGLEKRYPWASRLLVLPRVQASATVAAAPVAPVAGGSTPQA